MRLLFILLPERRSQHHCTSPSLAMIYDLPVPAIFSSLIPMVGILLNRLLLPAELDFVELGDEL